MNWRPRLLGRAGHVQHVGVWLALGGLFMAPLTDLLGMIRSLVEIMCPSSWRAPGMGSHSVGKRSLALNTQLPKSAEGMLEQ